MGSSIFEDLENFHDTSLGIDFRAKSSQKKEMEKAEAERKALKPSERLLYDIKSKGFNLSQMETILKTKGDQLVVSCAGSGKTTTMIFKILYDIKSGFATRPYVTNAGTIRIPEKIWVCTFLSTGADELCRSLKKWENQLGMPDVSSSIQFSTIHAEFKRALAQSPFKFSLSIVDNSTNSNYLKQVVKPYQLTNEKGNALNSEDYNKLEGALNYSRNRLDEKRYEHDTYQELGIAPALIDAILRDWKALRVQNNVIDFDDMQELIYTECYERNNEELRSFLAKRYNFIYIDEFQDTSQIQYAILKLYAVNYRQVFAIGDDDQTIYSWRGSDSRIITQEFPKDFNPVINQLSINYRCPANILKAIVPSISLNENRYDKPLNAANEGGKVRLLRSSSYVKMVETLADLVHDDLVNNRSVAILCRTNIDGLMPAMLFDSLDKFAYSISGEGMTLNSYIGGAAKSIVHLFTEKATPTVRKALNQLAWDQYNINRLVDSFRKNKTSIWTIDLQDLEYSCPSISKRIASWRAVRENKSAIDTLKYVLQDVRVNVYYKDSQFNTVMRSTLLSLEAMLNLNEYGSVEEFQDDLEDMNERLLARKKQSNSMVKIATVHEFKGKEADSVYVWNDSEDVFPVKKVRDKLYSAEYEEERRVHYIACTRAKKISTIVHLQDQEGSFVHEMDLSEAEILGNSGKIAGIISTNAKEDANLRKFAKECTEDECVEEEIARARSLTSFVGVPEGGYADLTNEFWEDDPLGEWG